MDGASDCQQSIKQNKGKDWNRDEIERKLKNVANKGNRDHITCTSDPLELSLS